MNVYFLSSLVHSLQFHLCTLNMIDFDNGWLYLIDTNTNHFSIHYFVILPYLVTVWFNAYCFKHEQSFKAMDHTELLI